MKNLGTLFYHPQINMADWKPCILEAKPGLSFDLRMHNFIMQFLGPRKNIL